MFEDLFYAQFHKKIMIDALYWETRFENIYGIWDYLSWKEDSLLHKNILKIYLEDGKKIV